MNAPATHHETEHLLRALHGTRTVVEHGRVVQAGGTILRATGLRARIGAQVEGGSRCPGLADVARHRGEPRAQRVCMRRMDHQRQAAAGQHVAGCRVGQRQQAFVVGELADQLACHLQLQRGNLAAHSYTFLLGGARQRHQHGGNFVARGVSAFFETACVAAFAGLLAGRFNALGLFGVQRFEAVTQGLRFGQQRHLGSAQHQTGRRDAGVAAALPENEAHRGTLGAARIPAERE
ncbi:MAG TPA: hypothetical protein VLJ62_08180 [Burkholderiaceae bacterium]|nr:hypothetical protein [Burkholderiaceae bacterium]